MASMNLTKHDFKGKELIDYFAKKLNDLADSIGDEFNAVVDLIASCRGKVVLIGLGKSGHIARLFSASLKSLGFNSYFLHATEANHGDMGCIDPKKDLIIFFSFSGKSKELSLIYHSIQPTHSILICGNTSTDLAKSVNVAIDIKVAATEEAWPLHTIPSTSLVNMTAITYSIIMCVANSKEMTLQSFSQNHPAGSLGALLTTKVISIARPVDQLPIVSDSITVLEALPTMTSGMCGCIILTDRCGDVKGIFTDGDLRRTIQKYPNLDVGIQTVMSKDFATCNQDILASEALETMHSQKITSLLVMESQQLKGFIHIHDLLKLYS